MQRAPDSPHSKYPHVYPIVRIDTPLDPHDPQSKIMVVKVLTSQKAVEAEVSRLNQTNDGKVVHIFTALAGWSSRLNEFYEKGCQGKSSP